MRSWDYEQRLARRVRAVLRVRVSMVGWSLALFSVGCTSQLNCKNVEGREQCVQSGGAGEGAVTGAAAGALWLGGGGCAIAGCRPPMTCNQQTGFCEHLTCGEGSGRCPDGTRCDSQTHTCR
jgi:hypothetical protein